MKKYLLMLFLLTAMVAGTTANADTIDFSQFGPDFKSLGSPITGTTTDGVTVTITSPNNAFTVLTEGTSWTGIFPTGAPILWDGWGPGSITLDFGSAIASLTLAGQSNYYGAYTETAYAYDALNNLVDTDSADGFNHIGDSYPLYTGSVPFLNLTGTGITKVVWGATNDGAGLALYGGAGAPAVPEPSTVILLGFGLVGIAGAARKKMKK